MKHFFISFLTFILFFNIQAQNEPIFEGLSGTSLFNELRNSYKTSTVLSYNDARDVLFGQIDKRNDSLECIYSGYQVFMPAGVDPTTAACQGDGCPGINTEHVYPQSLWSGIIPKSDMHHLYPSKASVNNARSSEPFADLQDNFTDTWFYKDQEMSSIPNNNINLYAEDINGFFEPRESVKGDIARAMFYFYTMYRDEANAVDPNFFNSQVSTLCQWHNDDPALLDEMIRTWKIAGYQDGKPNPFVLDCTLASRIYCPNVGWYCQQISNNFDLLDEDFLSINPNPATNKINIDWMDNNTNVQEAEIHLYDLMGKEIMSKIVQKGNDLEISELPKGMIIAKLQFGRQIATKKFIHL